MVSFLSQATQEKEVYLKKAGKKFIILLTVKIFIIFSSGQLLSNEIKILEYFNNINNFSSLFLQIRNGEISEGELYYNKKRLRIDYTKPTKILIILDKNKAMYFNKDLNEVEYFNPKKTVAKIFFDIFNQKNFFFNSELFTEKNMYKLKKKVILENEEEFEIIIVFEKNPTLIRNIKIVSEDGAWEYSILNHNFNPDFQDDFFSMANPTIGQ